MNKTDVSVVDGNNWAISWYPIDFPIADFSKKTDISYLYVTHNVQSRCLTHKEEKDDEPIVEESECISVYSDDISAWR